MTEPHDHEIDGALRESCPMCQRIMLLTGRAKHDAKAMKALDDHRKRAEKSSGC
jgi:hypothetical protein